jgi:pilus assembly protein Flp/PilA
MKNVLKNFIADETGATAIEYLGSTLKLKFGSISTSLK